MCALMKNEDQCRKVFSLTCLPPRLYDPKRSKRRDIVPIFEPYQEALPLEAGYYTFVIDNLGRFRVERGNTSTHAGMIGGGSAGAAGHFLITRAGKVGRVVCKSYDYGLSVSSETHPTVRFVLDAFARHQAFDISPFAIFQFSKGLAESFHVSADGTVVEDYADRIRSLEAEGQGADTGQSFEPGQVAKFAAYSPVAAPRLYSMHLDNEMEPIDFDARDLPELGEMRPPFSLEARPLNSGKKAFVIDSAGRLIVGYGHQILSGGNPVGSAGQIYVAEDGNVAEINLNFSEHFRPPLTAEYARYTYRSLIHHPLLRFSADCRISGRRFFGLDTCLDNISFLADELLADGPDLEILLDDNSPISDDYPGDEESLEIGDFD